MGQLKYTDDAGITHFIEQFVAMGVDENGTPIVQSMVGDAVKTSTQPNSTNAYGAHIETWGSPFSGIAQASASEVIYRSPDVTHINSVSIECTSGTVAVEVSNDNWVTKHRVPIRAIDAGGVVAENAVQLVAGERGVLDEELIGKFSAFQIVWLAGADANANGRYGVK